MPCPTRLDYSTYKFTGDGFDDEVMHEENVRLTAWGFRLVIRSLTSEGDTFLRAASLTITRCSESSMSTDDWGAGRNQVQIATYTSLTLLCWELFQSVFIEVKEHGLNCSCFSRYHDNMIYLQALIKLGTFYKGHSVVLFAFRLCFKHLL